MSLKSSDQQIYEGLWHRLVMVCGGDEQAANLFLQEAIADAIARLIDLKAYQDGQEEE